MALHVKKRNTVFTTTTKIGTGSNRQVFIQDTKNIVVDELNTIYNTIRESK